MKNTQVARFFAVLAVGLFFSSCTAPNEPFFKYNSPFGGRNTPGASRDFANQPAPSPGAGDIGDPGVSGIPANAEQKSDERSLVSSPGTTPEATPEAAPEARPDIYIHKRGPAGTMCYTCRGKGYVLQPTTTSSGDIYTCPACGGDGRY